MEDYQADIETILSHQTDNGFKLWTTIDGKIGKGAPFSTMESTLYLLDLGLPVNDTLFDDVSKTIFDNWKDDGRIKISPTGGIYPCQTASAFKVLCYLGHSQDERLRKTLQHFIDTQENDGGWKCNKYSFGRGEETNHSTPNTTLVILDCLRFFDFSEKETITNSAVEFLLEHWVIKKPISPCHYGIGKLFMQIEYPFRGYNLFYYLYILSFYKTATTDKRFLEAYHCLEKKVVSDEVIVERVVPKLGKLSFCRKGYPSKLATEKYHEIKLNMTLNDQ